MRNRGLFHGAFIISSALLMANLGAMIDFFLHPDIPYFDEEHLIVGGITGLLTAMLLGAIILYVRRLQEALNKVKTLSGMLPICASCKKIRDDNGYWSGVETYVSKHTEVVFSHGLCPECEKKMYKELEQLKNGDT